MNNQMTKLRKPNTIEFALQNALKNLTEEEKIGYIDRVKLRAKSPAKETRH